MQLNYKTDNSANNVFQMWWSPKWVADQPAQFTNFISQKSWSSTNIEQADETGIWTNTETPATIAGKSSLAFGGENVGDALVSV